MKCVFILLAFSNIAVWCDAGGIGDFISQIGDSIKKIPDAIFGERPHSARYHQHPEQDHHSGPHYNQHRPDHHHHQHDEHCQHGSEEYDHGNNQHQNNHGQWNQNKPNDGGGYPLPNGPLPANGQQNPGNGYGYNNYYNRPYQGYNPYHINNDGYNPYQDSNLNGFNNYPNSNNNDYNPYPNGNDQNGNIPYNPGQQPHRRPDNQNFGNQNKPNYNLYPNLDDLNDDNRFTPGLNQGNGDFNNPNKNSGNGGLISIPGSGQQTKPFSSQPGYPEEPNRKPNNNITPVSPIAGPNVPVPTATEEEEFQLDIRFGEDNSTKPIEANNNATKVLEVEGKSEEAEGIGNRKLFDTEGCPDGKHLNNAGDCVKSF